MTGYHNGITRTRRPAFGCGEYFSSFELLGPLNVVHRASIAGNGHKAIFNVAREILLSKRSILN